MVKFVGTINMVQRSAYQVRIEAPRLEAAEMLIRKWATDRSVEGVELILAEEKPAIPLNQLVHHYRPDCRCGPDICAINQFHPDHCAKGNSFMPDWAI